MHAKRKRLYYIVSQPQMVADPCIETEVKNTLPQAEFGYPVEPETAATVGKYMSSKCHVIHHKRAVALNCDSSTKLYKLEFSISIFLQ